MGEKKRVKKAHEGRLREDEEVFSFHFENLSLFAITTNKSDEENQEFFSCCNLARFFEIINPTFSLNDLYLSRMWKRFSSHEMHSFGLFTFRTYVNLSLTRIFSTALFRIEISLYHFLLERSTRFFCNWHATIREEERRRWRSIRINFSSYFSETKFSFSCHVSKSGYKSSKVGVADQKQTRRS